MLGVLVEALFWIKLSLHLQCYVLRAFYIEVLNLSPCSVLSAAGQKGGAGAGAACRAGPWELVGVSAPLPAAPWMLWARERWSPRSGGGML